MFDTQMLQTSVGPPDLARLAAGMHLVSVALHAANVLLLFLVLRAMTADFWPSAAVAAVFAVHPLHVESVAWITERKDVLSGLFGLLSLAAYVRYARGPSVARYLPVAVAFVLGLMAKPMLVTWPLLFLLLDYWPLRRRFGAALLLEKALLLALSVALASIAYFAQQSGNSVFSLESVPIWQRLARAAEVYVIYLGKSFWPTGLAVLYPEPPQQDYFSAFAAAMLLALLTVGAAWAATGPQSAATVARRGLVLVSRHAPARNRTGPRGRRRHGRPLPLLAADRPEHRAGLGRGGPGTSAARLARSVGGRRGAGVGGPRRMRLAADGPLAQHRNVMDPCPGLYLRQLHCPRQFR